jgi:hypothetical protein
VCLRKGDTRDVWAVKLKEAAETRMSSEGEFLDVQPSLSPKKRTEWLPWL